jgi:TolB-like protein/Tfp pilus assembly protein PilF
MSLFAELTRRKVFKIGGAYLVVAWLAVQAASIGFPAFDAPPWMLRVFILVTLLGFPIALVFAWAFDITPEGVKAESGVRSTRTILLVAAVLIALAFVWYFKGQPSYRAETPPAPASAVVAKQASVEPAMAAAPSNGKSIAVLAFSDLSPAHDQGYFSDGMAEEILNALAQVKDLKVAGRTSSFFYKGKNEDLRTIGKTLGVANILEGSVRKQGDKVRITAQLIQVSDDTHLWSHAYDGDLSDVFQLQENIARAITDQLKVVLIGVQNTHLVQVGTTNTGAYNLYLHATEVLNQRDYQRMGEAIGWLQQAIALDPNFARAHARLAMIHTVGYGGSETEAAQQAQIALKLDPSLPETQSVLGMLAGKQRDRLHARAAMNRALELAPDDASANLYAAENLIITGYTRQGIVHLDRALSIDPLLPNAINWRAMQYEYAGDLDVAERMFQRAVDLGLSIGKNGLGQVAAARGEYATARAMILPFLLKNVNSPCVKTPQVSMPIYLEGEIGGDAPARIKALGVIDECLAGKPVAMPVWVPIGLMRLDQPQRALQVIALAPTGDEATLFVRFWSPLGRAARHLPEFPDFARKVGFAALWDKYGAPDLCRKNAAGDYVCE